jgi:hypothetical protein
MGLLTRTEKGSKLTIEEMDENLNYLKSLAISNSGPAGPTGPTGPTGAQANLLAVPTNIIPDTDNYYTLGNEDFRWQSVHIGTGTIFITDTVLGTDAGLTVTDGVLLIDGANQLQVGELKFVDNTIESTSGATDIEIGLTGSTADLVLNRNTVLAPGKSLTFSDSSVQTTAYVPPADTTYNSIFGTTGGTQPTFTGTPLVTGSYVLNGDLVYFRVNVDMSNITNFGTGQYTLTLPFINKYDTIISNGHLHDNTPGTDYVIFGEVSANSNIATLYYQINNSQLESFDHNSPKALQTVDFFHISGTYIMG